MLTSRIHGIHSIHWAMQIVLAQILFWTWLACFKVFYGDGILIFIKQYVTYSLILLFAMLFYLGFRERPSSGLITASWIQNHKVAFRHVAFCSMFLFVFLILSKDTVISRLFIFSFLGLLYVLFLLSNRFSCPVLARRLFANKKRAQRTLLIGSLSRAEDLKAWIDDKEKLGFHVVGMISDDAPNGEKNGVKVLGGTEDLERIIREEQVTQIFLLEFPFFPNFIRFVASICNKFGLRLIMLNDLDEKIGHSLVMYSCDGVKLIGLRNEPLENPFHRVLKRMIDIGISLPVVVFILPVLYVVAWVFTKIQSPGPVLYRQLRAGMAGEQFEIIKFRTMHINNESQAKQATKTDKRIFPFGKMMRRLSLDEFPQFINVLKGNMSVVGPRPHLLEHDKEFEQIMAHYNVRYFVKPGITGLAQVRGQRGELVDLHEDLEQRIASDIQYLERWTIGLDFLIIARTFLQFIRPSSRAY